MSYQRVLLHAPATLRATFPDQDGEPRVVTGMPTVTVRKADGTQLATGAATVAGNVYSYLLTAAQLSSLERLTADWVATDGRVTTTIDVVGAVYFTLSEARSRDQSFRNDTTKYNDEDMLRIRQEVEDECESICGRAFVPRFGRTVLCGEGNERLRLGVPDLRRIRSVTVDDTALTADELADIRFDAGGTIYFATSSNSPWGRYFPYGDSNIVVEYEFGLNAPPADLKRATMTRLRNRLNDDKRGIPERATSQTTEQGTFSLFTPGLRGAHTGLPEVDEAYERYAWHASGVTSVAVI